MSEAGELAAALVALESTNPDLGAGGVGEGAVAARVAEWARDAGLDVSVEEIAPGRPNVVVRAHGSGGGRTLLLNGHTDTVGLGGVRGGLEPVVEGDRMYGRGSYDMKGALAAALVAASRVRGLRGDVVVTAVVDEEVASLGTEAVARSARADGAIVCEPTEEQVVVAHKGFVSFRVETRGVAAHGSRPDLGVDAIARMGRVLVALAALDERLRAAPSRLLLGTGSLHASLIEGGQEYSSYPERCVMRGERRTVPGESVADVEAELRDLLRDVDGEAQVEFSRGPFEIDPRHELVRLAQRHAGGELGGAMFWTDAALLADAGIPTVLLGPKGAGAHADEEWVSLASLDRCAELYQAIAEDFCA